MLLQCRRKPDHTGTCFPLWMPFKLLLLSVIVTCFWYFWVQEWVLILLHIYVFLSWLSVIVVEVDIETKKKVTPFVFWPLRCRNISNQHVDLKSATAAPPREVQQTPCTWVCAYIPFFFLTLHPALIYMMYHDSFMHLNSCSLSCVYVDSLLFMLAGRCCLVANTIWKELKCLNLDLFSESSRV